MVVCLLYHNDNVRLNYIWGLRHGSNALYNSGVSSGTASPCRSIHRKAVYAIFEPCLTQKAFFEPSADWYFSLGQVFSLAKKAVQEKSMLTVRGGTKDLPYV